MATDSASTKSTIKSTINLPGVDLTLIRKGSGPPLLLLHGGEGSLTSLPFADRLAERYEIIQPIHPGFDGTAIPDHFDNLQDLIFLYLDLIDALDLRDALLLGFSLGGWIAAELAVISTRPFTKLALVDPVGIKTGGPFDRDIADIFALSQADQARAAWHDPSLAPDPATMTDEELERLAGNRQALGLYTWEPYMYNPKLPRRLHRVNIPTLLIWGASDGIVTPRYGEAYRQLIPNAKMVVIPEAGHAPQVEQPEALVRHFLEFANP